MLNIYVLKQPTNTVLKNDNWFNTQFYKRVNVDNKISNLIYTIDKSEFMGGISIKTQDNNLLGLTYLSTGCKIAINVYTFPNKIFSMQEAGENALEQILLLDKGSIYMEIPLLMRGSIKNHYRVHGLYTVPRDYSTYGEFFKDFEDWGTHKWQN